MFERFKTFVLTNAVVILGIVVVFLSGVVVLQRVQLDGLRIGKLTLVEGANQKLATCTKDRDALKGVDKVRGAENEQSAISYSDLADACMSRAARAALSGRTIKEVTHVEEDPDGGPDGGVIDARRLRLSLGQPAELPDPTVPGRGDGSDTVRAPDPRRRWGAEASD